MIEAQEVNSMSKKVILVVKEPKNYGTLSAEWYADKLGQYVDSVYGEGLEKEIYKLNKGTYSLRQKGMEKIIKQYGKNIIVAFEWISRMTNKTDEFDYFYNLVQKGVEFCFSYDKLVWNKETDEETYDRIEWA